LESLVDVNLRPLAGELRGLLEKALSRDGAEVVDLAAVRARRGA
jgi:hypothetical protein